MVRNEKQAAGASLDGQTCKNDKAIESTGAPDISMLVPTSPLAWQLLILQPLTDPD